jgi:hypothetical protein
VLMTESLEICGSAPNASASKELRSQLAMSTLSLLLRNGCTKQLVNINEFMHSSICLSPCLESPLCVYECPCLEVLCRLQVVIEYYCMTQ